jgi:ribulose 1,5-bisphosphate synthetase/thiazole synthase
MMHMPARTSRQTHVVIVDSGAVGVAAGLEVHEAGAKVIVLEKEAQLGGGCSCPQLQGAWHRRLARPGLQWLDDVG